jgi:opacity protein-like surface antigen
MVWGLCGMLLVASPLAKGARGYVSLGTGIVYAPNERFEKTPVVLDYDLGFRVATLTAGYAFDRGLSVELEAAYRRNELEIIEFDDDRGVINTHKDDAVDSSSLMLNALYEFDWGSPLRPYLGVGLGAARIGYELTRDGTNEVILDDSGTSFAYQILAGVGVPLGRRFRLNADYRYWRNSKVDIRTEAGESVRTDHPIHQVSLSLRYAFSASEPPERKPSDPAGGRWYTELRLGTVAAEDSDIEDGLRDTNFDAFDVGGALAVAGGYAWQRPSGGAWRAELEAYRWKNEADVVDFGRLRGEFRLSGAVKTTSIGANLIYDFAGGAVLHPHAGLGVGFAEIDYDVTLHENGAQTYVDDTDSGFAAQALLGVSARLTPRLWGSLNYRYWWAPSVKLQSPQAESWKTEHSAHLLLLGLRYRLGS